MKNLRLLILLLALPLRAVELPIVFEPNAGQTDPRVQFLSRGPGSTLFLTGTEAVLKLPGNVLRIGFERAAPGMARALEPLPGVTHYYVGNDPAKWRTNVPQYGRVKRTGVYPGIDLVWYGREGNLEFDFVVAPGADPDAIALTLGGAERLEIAPTGDLIVHLKDGILTFQRPISYQDVDGKRREVSSSYRLADGRLGFELGDYDRGRPLVIDPLLVWSSFLGGGGIDQVLDVAVAASGNVYATGNTTSADFPEAFTSVDDFAVFVTQVDAEGQGIVFTTILDGGKGETGFAIAVDGQGNAYVTGQTDSRDFPVADAFQPSLGFFPNQAPRLDAFVAKLTSSGAFVFCTYLGGGLGDSGGAIALDANQRVYVGGWTTARNFPLKNEFQNDAFLSNANAFLTVFAADGQSLVYSTQLGGGSLEEVRALAVDASGNAYLAGDTGSSNFPLKGPFQGDQPGTDAFVAKINPAASGEASLVYSTYLGGQGTDLALGIAVDAFGQAHVTGVTGSTLFPLKEPLDGSNLVNEAFVTKLNAQGNGLLFSTFLGGSGAEQGNSIAVDGAGAVYVAGHTSSADFRVLIPIQGRLTGGIDAFVSKIDPLTSTLLWSTFLGGNDDDFANAVALDPRANVHVGGRTLSGATFPLLDPFQEAFGGGESDGFLARIEATPPDTIGRFRPDAGKHFLHNANTAGSPDLTVTLGQAGDLPVAGDWFGTGDRPGVFRAGVFTLKRFNNDILCCNTTFNFGEPGDLPVAGDWNGDGIDTVGVFRPSTAQFILTDTNGLSIDRVFNFGQLGDLPVAGDWDGDGVDTVGIFRPAEGLFVLTNTDGLTLDFIFSFGQPGDLPVMGDWNGDGLDTAGVLRGGQFELRNSNNAGPADLTVKFRVTGDLPIAGDWDGRP